MGTRAAVYGHAFTNYGTREIEDKFAAQFDQVQGQKKLVVHFNYDDLPTYSATDDMVLSIPANARIISSTLRVVTPFAGGTSYDIGLYTSAGVAIDADGIDAAVATAAINAIGETVVCDGALVNNTAGIGTTAGQIVIAATGTFTAGEGYLTVIYETLDDRI
jgi:hypothetical protein